MAGEWEEERDSAGWLGLLLLCLSPLWSYHSHPCDAVKGELAWRQETWALGLAVPLTP